MRATASNTCSLPLMVLQAMPTQHSNKQQRCPVSILSSRSKVVTSKIAIMTLANEDLVVSMNFNEAIREPAPK